MDTILVISNQVVRDNAKVNFPDMNYPNSGNTVLRYLHKIDYDNQRLQLDGEDGPWFDNTNFPKGVGFYTNAKKKK